MVIARIGMDKSLKVKNEFVENSNKVSFTADGTLYVNEIIEGDKFSINSNGIEVTEIREDYIFVKEEFFLDFVPNYPGSGFNAETNTLIIPQDCVLYMEYTPDSAVAVMWFKNGESIDAHISPDWKTRVLKYNQGDEISIQIFAMNSATYEIPIVLRLNGADGVIVADFVFEFTIDGCYLTTAMVGYFNKADDGIELTAMRELRSHSGYKYQDMLEEYSQASPIIIKGIEQSENKDYYYNMIKDVVDNIVISVANKKWEEAETAYLDLYYYLKERFGGI